MKRTFFQVAVTGFSVFLATVIVAQTNTPNASAPAATATPQKADAPRPVNRPPLTGNSYDIGRYEVTVEGEKTSVRFIETAKEIEAKIGMTFGFMWSLHGYTGTRLVPIRTVTKHPPFTPKGETTPRTMFDEKIYFKPINGTTNWPYLYKFETAEELVPGEWTMAVYYDTQLVAEHAFTVVPKK